MRWIQHRVEYVEPTLQSVLIRLGHYPPLPEHLEHIWTLPGNGPLRFRERYHLRAGDLIWVPVPDEVETAVAPSRDGVEVPAVIQSRPAILPPSAAFRERYDLFRAYLGEGFEPRDAWRSAFGIYRVLEEVEAMEVLGIVCATRGDDAGEAFLQWLYESESIAEELIAYESGPPGTTFADEPEQARDVWAAYPAELSAFQAYFLRSSYVRQVRRILPAHWASMPAAQLEIELRTRFSHQEIEAIFEQFSRRRSIIKTRIRGYGYITAMVTALVWAREDIARGDWAVVSAKAVSLLAATWVFIAIVGARDGAASRRFAASLARAAAVPLERAAAMAGQGVGYARLVQGVRRTNTGFTRAVRLNFLWGNWSLALAALDSPPVEGRLPRTPEEAAEIEAARARLGIPPDAYIDHHGHLKTVWYMQTDPLDAGHADAVAEQETHELLWWLGVPLTYRYNGVVWTVPGREWL